MKLSELKGKAVVSMAEARKVGVVEDALVDPSHRKIEAIKVRADGQGPEYIVAADSVRGIGPDAVTIASQDALVSPGQAPNLASLPSLTSVLQSQVVTEGGEFLGTITEVDFDPDSRQIQDYVYAGGALDKLLGRQHRIAVGDVVGVGRGVVTIRKPARPSQAA